MKILLSNQLQTLLQKNLEYKSNLLIQLSMYCSETALRQKKTYSYIRVTPHGIIGYATGQPLWGYFPGTLSCSEVSATDLKIPHY